MEKTEDTTTEPLANWLQKLGAHAGADTLLRFAPSATNCIDLTHAHPSGLAQLLTGRKTRLSTLLREPAQYAAGGEGPACCGRRSMSLAPTAESTSATCRRHASWRVPDTGRSEQLSAPVLLAAVSLTVRPEPGRFNCSWPSRPA